MASGKPIPLEEAKKIAAEAVQVLEDSYVEKAQVVGSIARNHPTVHDIDLLVIPKKGSALEEDPGEFARNLSEAFGHHIDVFLTDEESWEASLIHWVIGRAIIPLKSHARKLGMHLNRYGLFDHAERPISRSISGIYNALETKIPQCLQPFLK